MKYLGVDFGLRKIGLAISEGELASPWQVLEVKGFSDAVEKISRIIEDNNFDKIVVGLPEGKMGQNVTGFVSALRKKGFEVETSDETLSSKKALTVMIEQGVRRKGRRREEDAYSAAGILQEYLDSRSVVARSERSE
ncbi:MAG: Holliday junction resolvase RuvX [Patescibacteria group bacterium]|nr:Holliday junction resolvase RuvX [Patescibacteria group bacterium]